MNALHHRWIESRAKNRSWAMVAGLPSARSRGRPLMVLQAYIDDSYDVDGWFVLAGHIATAENWSAFSDEWGPLVRSHGIVRADGRYHFKMNEMMAVPERRERLPAFINAINRHADFSLAAQFRLADLKKAREAAKLAIPENIVLTWGKMKSPFMHAFVMLMQGITSMRHIVKNMPQDEPIDFIFDEQSEKSIIIPAWEDFKSTAGFALEHQILLGATPRFEDDMDFLPLQAADMLAWLQRYRLKFADDGGDKTKIKLWDGPAKNLGFRNVFNIEHNETTLTEWLFNVIRAQHPNLLRD